MEKTSDYYKKYNHHKINLSQDILDKFVYSNDVTDNLILQSCNEIKHLSTITNSYMFNLSEIMSISSWLNGLARSNNNKIKMDDSIFIQLCMLDPDALSFEIRIPLTINYYSYGIYYIEPTNHKVKKYLQRHTTSNKGQWVIEIGDNKYTGLTELGIKTHSFNRWSLELTDGIIRDIVDKFSPLKNIENISYKSKDIDINIKIILLIKEYGLMWQFAKK